MNRKRAVRVAGFVGAVGASAALVAAASSGTGAYFEDSHDGSLKGSSGQLVTVADHTNINFQGLNPGEDRSQKVTFGVRSSSTTGADIWLVFNQHGSGYGALTGAKTTDTSEYNGVTEGGMGQYGHFKVVGAAGQFESYNLQLPNTGAATGGYTSHGTNTCFVNADGHGGSAAKHQSGAGNDIAECGVPAMILLQKNLAPGHSGSATVTFGLTGKQTQQNQQDDPNVQFKIVATQPGVSPGASW